MGEFRKMRRFNQELSEKLCVSILKEEPRGILAVNGDNDYPYAFPMNYLYDEGKIYFHCGKEGYKLDALKRSDKVSFCVCDKGFIKDGEWALNIQSVIVFGRIRFIDEPEETISHVRKLALKYYPTEEAVEEEIRKVGSKVQILELTIEYMTGKLVKES